MAVETHSGKSIHNAITELTETLDQYLFPELIIDSMARSDLPNLKNPFVVGDRGGFGMDFDLIKKHPTYSTAAIIWEKVQKTEERLEKLKNKYSDFSVDENNLLSNLEKYRQFYYVDPKEVKKER